MMAWEFFISKEHLQDFGIAIGIFLLFLLFRKIFTKYVFALLLKFSRILRGKFLPNVFLAFEKPFQWLFIIIGIYAAVKYYPYLDHSNYIFINLIRASIIFLFSCNIFNLASRSSLHIKTIYKNTSFKIDVLLCL